MAASNEESKGIHLLVTGGCSGDHGHGRIK